MESMVVPQLSIHLGNEQIPLSIEALASLLATYKTDQINSTAQESYQAVQEEPNLNLQAPSNSSLVDQAEIDLRNKKMVRGSGKSWKVLAKFETEELFQSSDFYLGDKKVKYGGQTYKYQSSKATKNGQTTVFWCEFSKRRKGYNCPCQVRTVKVFQELTIEVSSDEEHEHAQSGERKQLVWEQSTEDNMKDLIKLDITSRNLRKSLESSFTNENFPSKSSIYSKTKRLKAEMHLSQVQTSKDFLQGFFVEQSRIPEDSKQLYIMDYMWEVNEENADDFQFAAIFSTNYLVDKLLRTNDNLFLAFDVTYNLNTDGFPVLIFGTIDEIGTFHYAGFVLLNKENTSTFSYFLKWIDSVSSSKPKFCMADGASSITAALTDVFPQCQRLMCYFHMIKNVKLRLTKLKSVDESIFSRLKEDIFKLRLLPPDEESFDELVRLFVEKWTDKNKLPECIHELLSDFCTYFVDQWCTGALKFWFQGANPSSVVTNNSIEALNQVIKTKYTLRQRLGLINLLLKMKDFTEDQTSRIVSYKEDESFENQLSKNMKVDGWRYLQKYHVKDNDRFLIKVTNSNYRSWIKHNSFIRGEIQKVYVLPMTVQQNCSRDTIMSLGKEYLKRRLQIDYSSFDHWITLCQQVAVVEKVLINTKYSYACNCIVGSKGKLCVHMTAIYFKEGLIEEPQQTVLASNVSHKSGQYPRIDNQF